MSPDDQRRGRRARACARKGRLRGGRPVGDDIEDEKRRNVVERFFNRMRSWRALASRHDEHATTDRGSVLAVIPDWPT